MAKRSLFPFLFLAFFVIAGLVATQPQRNKAARQAAEGISAHTAANIPTGSAAFPLPEEAEVKVLPGPEKVEADSALPPDFTQEQVTLEILSYPIDPDVSRFRNIGEQFGGEELVRQLQEHMRVLASTTTPNHPVADHPDFREATSIVEGKVVVREEIVPGWMPPANAYLRQVINDSAMTGDLNSAAAANHVLSGLSDIVWRRQIATLDLETDEGQEMLTEIQTAIEADKVGSIILHATQDGPPEAVASESVPAFAKDVLILAESVGERSFTSMYAEFLSVWYPDGLPFTEEYDYLD